VRLLGNLLQNLGGDTAGDPLGFEVVQAHFGQDSAVNHLGSEDLLGGLIQQHLVDSQVGNQALGRQLLKFRAGHLAAPKQSNQGKHD